MTELLLGLCAVALVAIFGVKVARWVETTQSDEDATRTGVPQSEPVSPLALRSWRHFAKGEVELTLENGEVYREDGISWFAWPSGAEVDWYSNFHRKLKSYRDQIRRGVPRAMQLQVKT